MKKMKRTVYEVVVKSVLSHSMIYDRTSVLEDAFRSIRSAIREGHDKVVLSVRKEGR